MKRPFIKTFLLLVLFFPSASFATVHTVVLKNYQFNPSRLTIHQNDTVKWVHQQRNKRHDVDSRDGISFESPDLFNGKVFTHKFTETGNFPYHCTFHRNMTGVITVKP